MAVTKSLGDHLRVRTLLVAAWLSVGAYNAATFATEPHRTCEELAHAPSAHSLEREVSSFLYALREDYIQRILPEPYDPFALSTTLERSKHIYDVLSIVRDPQNPELLVRSVVGDILDLQNSGKVPTFADVIPLVDKLKVFSQMPNPTLTNLYRGSVATEHLIALLSTLFPRPSPVTGPREEAPTANDEPLGLGEPVPAGYPELPENYTPHSSEGQSSPNPSLPTIITEANWEGVSHFQQRRYNSVRRHRRPRWMQAEMPFSDRRVRNYRPTAKKIKVHLSGHTQVSLILPDGYIPVAFANPELGKIIARPGGAYQLETQLASVEINVIPDDETLNPAQYDMMREPYGVGPQEWPDQLRQELLDPIREWPQEKAVAKVEYYIRNQIKYSKDPVAEDADILEIIKLGKFKCDYATDLMVAIVRDYLHLPARAISGFRGKTLGDGRSLVVTPNGAHSYVQVYFNGRWKTYDPTPKDQDPQTKQQLAQSDFQEINKEYPDDDAPEPSAEPRDAVDDRPQDHRARVREDSQRTLAEMEQSTPGGDPAQPDPLATLAWTQELESAIELGRLSRQDPARPGMLNDRAQLVYLRATLNPALETYDALQRLQALKNDASAYNSALAPIFALGEQALARRQRPAVNALNGLAGRIFEQPLVNSFQTLVQVEDRLNLFTALQELEDQAGLRHILADLRRIKITLQKLNSPGKISVGTAEKFINGLGAHARRLVQDAYHLDDIGPNLQTEAMMKDLRAGKLRDYNLMRILLPLTDFILDAVPAPAYKEIMLWEEDRSYVRGSNFLPATDLGRAFQALRLQPLKTYAQNLREGSLIQLVRRRKVRVRAAGGVADPQRLTLALYDTSRSMWGKPAIFQAALLAAFIDRALSDLSANGMHRHTARLLGFDSRVHSAYPALNSEQAIDIIRNHLQRLKNTGGSTNIMEALRYAVAQIIKAQKDAAEPLASANIILMSDGQSNVDLEALRQLFASVDPRTPLKFMFVAINGKNKDLIELTRLVKSAGAAEAFYLDEYTPEHINDIIKESEQAPEVNLQRELYAEQRAQALPQQTADAVQNLAFELNTELARLRYKQMPRSLEDWQREVSITFGQAASNHESNRMAEELSRLRGLIAGGDLFKAAEDVTLIVDDLLKNAPLSFGRTLSDLNPAERGNLTRFVEEAIAYAKGRGRVQAQ